ncbi:hypothetical protein E2C01_082191 [Portunus trituberculatus]|uniref:Uncharacterized protein n=1 Tax=Portunus trituberculatus TaxID=210409 RepID=A0A5B7IP99_PORTR|nr:hypothetical protein [Portunus trituberculatus]
MAIPLPLRIPRPLPPMPPTTHRPGLLPQDVAHETPNLLSQQEESA